MAIEKTLNTRIQLKHDTLANWTSKNTELKKGEIAIAVIEGINPADKLHQPVMFKVGPGNFNDLEWASAIAADVYAWAKKPSLDANDLPEIPGLKLGISFEVVGEGNAITNVAYDTTSKKFTFTKGETFATKQELEDVVANGTVVAEGAKIDVALDGNTYTVSHEAIAQAEAGKTVAARTYITGVTTDGYGHITGYTTASEEDQDLSNYKTKQEAYSAAGAVTKTVTGVTQDANGEINVTYDDIAIAAAQVTDFDASVKGIKVDNATNADVATKDSNNNVIVDTYATKAEIGTHPTYSETLIADDATVWEAITNTHLATLTGLGVDIVYSSADKRIFLTNKNSSPIGNGIDASDFIKDGMIDSVSLSEDGLNLTITWNTDAGKEATIIPLSGLVDVYTGVDGEQIKVDVSSDNKISAILKDSVVEDIAKGVSAKSTISTYGDIVTHNVAEFATAEQGTKADTAFGWGDHAQAGYATSATVNTLTNDLTQGNITVGKAIEADTLDGKHAADFVLSTEYQANQEATDKAFSDIWNGESTVGHAAEADLLNGSDKDDIISAAVSQANKYFDDNFYDNNTEYSAAADGGLKLDGTAFSIDDSITWIFDCGGAE